MAATYEIAKVSGSVVGAVYEVANVSGTTTQPSGAIYQVANVSGTVAATPVLAAIHTQTVEALAAVTLTALTTNGTVPTSYVWTQVAGPTVSMTTSGNTMSFQAPGVLGGTYVQFTVQANGTSNTITAEVDVYGATDFILEGSTWVPAGQVTRL